MTVNKSNSDSVIIDLEDEREERDPKREARLQEIDRHKGLELAKKFPPDWRKNPHMIQKKFKGFIIGKIAQYFNIPVKNLEIVQGGSNKLDDGSFSFWVEGPERKIYIVNAEFDGTQLINYTCFLASE